MGKKKPSKQFVSLEYAMLDSPAWQSLTKAEVIAYIYFRRCRCKRVKGKTINPFDAFIEYGHSDCPMLSSRAFTYAMVGLRCKGFVRLVRAGRFPHVKAAYAVVENGRIGVLSTPTDPE